MRPWENENTTQNGRTIQENFKDWFSNSKVIDDAGAPLVLYHATPHDFTAFHPGGREVLSGQQREGQSGTALWFSPYAEHQAASHNISAGKGLFKDGTQVMPVYLKMERPMVIDTKEILEWAREVFAEGSSEFPQILLSRWKQEITKDNEYDGVIFDGEAIGWGKNSKEYIVFDPKQVKSALGNSGLYLKDSACLTDKQAAWELELAQAALAHIPSFSTPKAAP